MATALRNESSEFYMKDSELTYRFYSTVFGWECVEHNEHVLSFKQYGFLLRFSKALPFACSTPCTALYVRDLLKTYELILMCGGRIIKAPFKVPGGQSFHFTDPSGNSMSVWSDRGMSEFSVTMPGNNI